MLDFGFDAVLAVVLRDEEVRPVALLAAAVAFPPFAPAFAFCDFEPAEPAVDFDAVFAAEDLALVVFDFGAVDLPPVVFAFDAVDERPEPVFDFDPPVDLAAVDFDLDAAVARPPFAPAFAFCAELPPLAVFDELLEVLDFDAVDFEDLPAAELRLGADDLLRDDAVDFDAVEREPLDFELPDFAAEDFDFDEVDFEEDFDPDDFEPEDFDPEVFLVVAIGNLPSVCLVITKTLYSNHRAESRFFYFLLIKTFTAASIC